MTTRRLVGIDLGIASTHTVRVLNEAAETVAKRKCWPTLDSLADVERAALSGTPEGTRLEVIMEPTGPAWLPIAVFFASRGHAVFRVSSAKASDLRKFFSRHTKTNGIDADTLARIGIVDRDGLIELRLPDAPNAALDRRVRACDRLTAQASEHKMRIKDLVRQLLPMSPLSGDLGAADLAVLERFADPNLLVKTGAKRLGALITKTSHAHQGAERAAQWIAAAEASLELYGGHCAVAFADLAAEVATEIRLLRAIQAELAGHAAARETAYQQVDPDGLARSLPGLAIVGGPALVAAMGDPARFARGKQFRSFTGLVPKDGMWGPPRLSRNHAAVRLTELEEDPVRIVGAFDIHRSQLTFEYVDTATGEFERGKIAPADRAHLRAWLARFAGVEGEVHFAMEGCTGWRYVAEEVIAVGGHPHVAEPADAAALRGKKQRAKTDRTDTAHLRDLLASGRIPESWVPPTCILEARAKVRLYKDLSEERTRWNQRVHASLFHAGVPSITGGITTGAARQALGAADLSPAVRQAVTVGMAAIDERTRQLNVLRAELAGIARHQPACRVLQANLYGVGPLTSVFIWAEMGDCRRFATSRDAVRHTGLDITVYSSDSHRAPGHLSRQGPGALRWALYEAAKSAARPTSPDHAYYAQVRARQGAHRATLSVARKLARASHHLLRGVGDDVLADWQPADTPDLARAA